ncbi:uncharacterized protein PG986_001485 [Apiospora aurea]|uniref:N-acetyltransferase domain-containing protein n=1 Tax=Apiospora aurea TaxID=335848 RepID=A0ABR1QX47_9PEZI
MSHSKQPMEITLGSNGERIERSMEVMVPAFVDDAMFKYFTYHHSPEKRKVLLRVLLRLFVQLGCAGGGHLLEVDGWGAAAVYLPPGKLMPTFSALFHRGVLSALLQLGYTSCKRAYQDFLQLVDGLKRKHLTAEERKNGYGYLAIIGTSPARQGQGLGSALLRRLQAMAGDRPIWLEASSAGSRRLYERHGFAVVEEVVVGRGRVGADGLAKAEGEGVAFWAMIWRRPEKGRAEMVKE